jgi:hypothetical protein
MLSTTNRVLSTYELLELILTYLPPARLLLA